MNAKKARSGGLFCALNRQAAANDGKSGKLWLA
jgi:hypothetical protein